MFFHRSKNNGSKNSVKIMEMFFKSISKKIKKNLDMGMRSPFIIRFLPKRESRTRTAIASLGALAGRNQGLGGSRMEKVPSLTCPKLPDSKQMLPAPPCPRSALLRQGVTSEWMSLSLSFELGAPGSSQTPTYPLCPETVS